MHSDTSAALRRWAELFNTDKYFAAHEVLEQPWRQASEPEKAFLKGLVHVSVALYQYRRGNGHGARVKYASGKRYLSAYAPCYAGVHVEDLVTQLDRFFADLLALPEGASPPRVKQPWPRVQLDPETPQK